MRWWVGLPLFLILLGWSLTTGSVDTPWSAIWNTDSAHHDLIWQLRWPRIINGLLVGACLAVAGLLVQNMVKNPLADPYLLGISGGAAVVQLSVLMMGWIWPQSLMFVVGFAGSLLAAMLLLFLSYQGQIKPNKITLNGVVLAFGFAAIISFVLATANGQQIKSMMFWLMGDLSFAQPTIWLPLILALGLGWLWRHAQALDLMARGDLFAQKSGVNTKHLNLMVFVLAALLTAMAVAQAGTIGFVGLIIPHLARLLIGHQHRQLIPLAAVLGAAFLLMADTLARTVMSPVQLPVGVFTALVGVPVFLWLNRRV